MDMSNWMPAQGTSGAVIDPSMESGDWRAQLQTESRQRIVNKIMETLKKHLPFSAHDGIQELKKIALKFEEKIYTSATNQADYLRKISMKMLTMESRSQNPMSDPIQSSSAVTGVNPSDPGSQVMQNNQGQQNTVGNTMGPGNFVNQRQQIQGRQQLAPQQQQQQQQTPNSHYLYQQQLHQIAKQTLQRPSVQSQIQPGHLQQSQQLVMQPNAVQNQQPGEPQSSQLLMNHQQAVLRQRQQQAQPTKQNSVGQQTNAANAQHNIGQQNNYSDMQQHQQRGLVGGQNQLLSGQLPQQQLIGQHNNLSSMQQQQSGQQQQLLGSQSGNSNMQNSQHSGQQLLQSNMPMQQQSQQTSATLLPTQVQSRPGQLQQQFGMQQQSNLLQHDIQQRLPPSGVFQQQNVMDQQKQILQQQRAMPEASSPSIDSTAQTGNPSGGDWQEEVYQKLQAMKDMYLLDLNDMHQKILGKLQLADSLPQQPNNEQLEKLKKFKNMLEHLIQILQIPKRGILANFKDKLGAYEKQIIQVISSNRRKPMGQQQQAQPLLSQHMQSLQQSQQTHSQFTQVQAHETAMNSHGSMAPMQEHNMRNLQQSTAPNPSLSGGSNVQQKMMNSIHPNSNFNPGQSSGMSLLQQVSSGSLQQNPVSGPQQVNIKNSSMLQHPHIKQEQMVQSQQLNQFQHRQMQRQVLQKQQFMQQQQYLQQTKQQQPYGQMQGNQLSLPNDGGDIKLRQQMSVKPGAFQQHPRSAYHQQLKPAAPFSPQQLSAASPQMSQHASPQIDQSSMFKSANSPFTVPSPSTSSASPIPGNTGHQQPSSAVVPAQSPAIGTPGISASPLLAEFTSPDGNQGTAASLGAENVVAEQPLERLLRVVKSISPKALSDSVGDISSVVSMMDRVAGSAPGNGSRAAVGEDLVAMTKCHLQARNSVTQDVGNGTRKMKRFISAMPLNVGSSAGSVDDGFKQLNDSETCEVDSTASSSNKRPRLEPNHALLEEIKEINRGLIDTVVSINEDDVDPAAASAASEGGDGTVVTCSFSAISLGPNLKSQYASAQMSPILPLRLRIPASYPNCSPILLDKFPAEVSKEFEDISTKAKSRLMISLRSVSEPMTLKVIARTWDACAAAVISEYAQQSGGGTFSCKYGTWENCLSAAAT